MKVYLIAAVAENGVIGANGGMPWHLPADMKHFKEATKGHPVIMGRKTWESLGKWKPLPDRVNIVITQTPNYEAKGGVVVDSFEAAYAEAQTSSPEKAFVIGGSEIYRLAEPHVDYMILTEIHRPFNGDTYFTFDKRRWQELERLPQASSNGIEFDFVTYEKIVKPDVNDAGWRSTSSDRPTEPCGVWAKYADGSIIKAVFDHVERNGDTRIALMHNGFVIDWVDPPTHWLPRD